MTLSENAGIVCIQEEIFLKEGISLLPKSVFSHGEVKEMSFTGRMEVGNAQVLCSALLAYREQTCPGVQVTPM